jgi:hypothetical protein
MDFFLFDPLHPVLMDRKGKKRGTTEERSTKQIDQASIIY